MHRPIGRASTSQMNRPTVVYPHPIWTGPPIHFPVQYRLAHGSSPPLFIHPPIGRISWSQMNRLTGVHPHPFLTSPWDVNMRSCLIHIGPSIPFSVHYRLACSSVSPLSMHPPIGRVSMNRPTDVHPRLIPISCLSHHQLTVYHYLGFMTCFDLIRLLISIAVWGPLIRHLVINQGLVDPQYISMHSLQPNF
jgi:hypothetical protein